MANISDLTIEFETRMVEVEADGSVCGICGDMIFMKAYRMDLFQPKSNRKMGSVSNKLFCQGCGEAIRDQQYGEDQDQFAGIEA
ncbi:unnamed protein product [marine sediment metagenome]|uniref:Uncharacterized protein n=1 Tax=marine sediment metagenome TaxID=412755 RepID=X1D255_9ZZZZ